MATLILLNKTELPKGTPSEALVAVWDKGSVPDGQISIPVELNERLLPIRDDLAAWTYETGCARINGKLLEEHLRADDNLSMWWCSTLVEKHPKVTHNLFPALKLRALELLLDEKGVTRLELCAAAGADPWMEDVLGRFCKATGREFAVRRIGGAEAAQPEGLKAKLKACYYRLPAPVKALVRFPAWLWIVRRRLPRTPLSRPALPEGVKPASIVTYFPNIDMAAAKNGRFRSRYWEKLHDALQPADGKPNRVNWVFIYFPAPQCSFPDAIKLRDRFRANGQDGASFHFLEEFLTNGDIAKSLVRFGKLLLSSRAVEPQVRELFRFPGSRMDLWPVLKDNWADSTRGWRALERCLMREAFRRYAEWAGPQEWTTFWDIYEYLPRETRGYVPAFVGASYAYAYHQQHGIQSENPPMPLATDTIRVTRLLHLGQVASTLDIPIETLRTLNPQYKMDIIPATIKSYTLVLPQHYLCQYIASEEEIHRKDSTYLKEYINPANIEKKKLADATPAYTTYTVKRGDTLGAIARRYRTTTAQIMKLNKLKNANKLREGQRLRIPIRR